MESILERVREATLTDRISGREEAKRLVASLRGGDPFPAFGKRRRIQGKKAGKSTARTRKTKGSPG